MMPGGTGQLIAQRTGAAILTLLIVSAVIFTITGLLPGDAAQQALGQSATPETLAALRAQMGLDQPAHVRYFHWLGGLLTGHLGLSAMNGLPVTELIATRLPNSLVLAGVTAAVSVPIALTLGIVSAMQRGSLLDRGLNLATLSLVAVPEFLIATIAVLIFAVKLNWLSALSNTADTATLGAFVRAYTMPVMTLCCVIIAQMARIDRKSVV